MPSHDKVDDKEQAARVQAKGRPSTTYKSVDKEKTTHS